MRGAGAKGLKRRREILVHIMNAAKAGYVPTMRELGEMTGLSVPGVQYQIAKLVADGMLEKHGGLTRRLVATPEARKFVVSHA